MILSDIICSMQYDVQKLPIDDYRQVIENLIEKNPVVIITAETGAGKSTRVPMWLWQKGKKVFVTQPRRIAVRSLSYYISKITSNLWGKEIGYQTGFDRKFSKETTLLYLTDGVQMIKEIRGKKDYDVLILDEIHEWNLNQEVLIGLVKKNLDNKFYSKTRKRIVIMSATLQAKKLSAFLKDAPIISIQGRGFPVTMHCNHPDFILSDTVQMVEMEKNTLVFEPGKKEIEEFILSLKDTLKHDKLEATILPLHSELSINYQQKVFKHYDIPKVIVSTDIAQTSLTIDDIDAVIDTGIKKEVHIVKGVEGLYPVDISKSECMQRAGRAGRVKNGQYILCSDLDIKDRIDYPEPEIRRLNMESVILRFIKWGISPLDFPYFHQPKRSLIYKAIQKLKVFEAISNDEQITEDGKKMAELPVSIQSSRFLIEATKGSRKVVEDSMKLISILETKGILNKEYMGGKYYSGPYSSDLLNQLAIWNSANKNKKIISYKKFSMAKEIYKELKKRIGFDKFVSINHLEGHKILLRAIISSFIDCVYLKSGETYIKDDEERQLDRTSILFKIRPDMVIGIPFDLVIERENQRTKEKEKKCLKLLTFATELSFKLLEELNPFSYKKEQEVKIENKKINVLNKIYFGNKILSTYTSTPDWKNSQEKEMLINAVLDWYEKNKQNYKLEIRKSKLEAHFQKIEKIIVKELEPFEFYWGKFISKELRDNLRSENLDMFFNFHSGFMNINFSDILPYKFIKELKKARWPKNIQLKNENLRILYLKNRPFLKLTFSEFEKIDKEDLVLPSGEKVGLILNNRKFFQWDFAVYYFNRIRKWKIFEEKWKYTKKSALIRDLIDLPFPQAFISGQGKKNVKFEFYAAPKIEGNEVYLIHFFSKENALKYFKSIEEDWKLVVRKYKQKHIEDIFKKKGWKVKK